MKNVKLVGDTLASGWLVERRFLYGSQSLFRADRFPVAVKHVNGDTLSSNTTFQLLESA
jgi:hypothetical protein